MNIKSLLLLITILLPITTFSMQNKKEGAMNEGAALAIGACGALVANIIPSTTLQEAILYNIAGLGLSSVVYLIAKSMKTAETGFEFGKKYIYYLGGFAPTAIGLLCLKQAMMKHQ